MANYCINYLTFTKGNTKTGNELFSRLEKQSTPTTGVKPEFSKRKSYMFDLTYRGDDSWDYTTKWLNNFEQIREICVITGAGATLVYYDPSGAEYGEFLIEPDGTATLRSIPKEAFPEYVEEQDMYYSGGKCSESEEELLEELLESQPKHIILPNGDYTNDQTAVK